MPSFLSFVAAMLRMERSAWSVLGKGYRQLAPGSMPDLDFLFGDQTWKSAHVQSYQRSL